MKWLKSATQKEWVINGRVIPKFTTPNNAYLAVQDSEYEQMLQKPVFKSLVNASGIMVLNTEPAELKNSIPVLKANNAELVAQISALQAENKKLTAEYEQFKKEALAELQEKQDTIDKLKASKKSKAKTEDEPAAE